MTAALIPVKPLSLSKSRLRAALSESQRRDLTIAMLGDVVAATLAADLWPVSVISSDPAVLAAAGSAGARAQAEPAGTRGLNSAVARGLEAMSNHGERSVLVILADVPMAAPDDLRKAAFELERHPMVVARANDGGTPLLGLRLPLAVELRYGPHSALRHIKAAGRAGMDALLMSLPSLQWDIDSPEDLERYSHEGPEGQTRRLIEALLPVPVA